MEGRAEASTSGSLAASVRFGPFELDLRAAELRKGGARVRLQDQPFQILRMLLQRPGEVVLREEIRDRLWPDNTVVEFDHSINAAVKRLREALGESAGKPRYIETLARRGYRFIVQVELAAGERAEVVDADSSTPAPFVVNGRDLATSHPPPSAAGGLHLPVQRLLILVAMLGVACAACWFVTRAKPIDSLAVMPFVNVGGDPNSEYVSDGITENLINNLSQLPGLRVVPRSLVFAYKGHEIDPRQVGRHLGVRAILTGRVVHRGNGLNIQTELVEVTELSQLWGQQYDGNFDDILVMQGEIARQVSNKLRLRSTREEQHRLDKRPTEDAEAYRLYLKGRYDWNRRTADMLKKANGYFQQAIEKDPGYGLAYAALAESYAVFSYYGVLSPEKACPKAEAAAQKALEIDEALGDAHIALGYTKMACEWDWPGSEREFKRALEIRPNDATARQWYGAYLDSMGRVGEAVAEYKQARKAEPLSLILSASIGHGLYFARKYEEAVQELRATIDMDPSFVEAHLRLGWVYEQRTMFAEAIGELRQALNASGEDPRVASALGHAYAIAGQRRKAEEFAARLEEQSRKRYVAPYDIAVVYSGLQETDRALTYLERAYEDRSYWLVWLRVDPRFDGIRSQPRFRDLLRRMHSTP